MTVEPAIEERCRSIEALVLDVDGVLTEGGIIYDDQRTESKQFHVRDGSALTWWRKAGKHAAVITGRSSRIVDTRAAELGIERVYQGVSDKFVVYAQILAEWKLKSGQVACVGDDFPDLPLIRNCGLGVAVADAAAELREDAHYITHARGGRGAVREIIELILRTQGHWQRSIRELRSRKLSED